MVIRRVVAAISVAAAVWAPYPAAAAATSAKALAVQRAPVPSLGVARWDTSGYYPQVSAAGVDLVAVNHALRAEVLHDEAVIRKNYDPTQFPATYRGTFYLGFKAALISASTVVVSTMYPSLTLYPGGNDGSDWVALTVAVPSGKVVSLVSLLHHGVAGLKPIAAYVEKHVVATDACVRAAVSDPDFGSIALAGFAPTVADYADFALAPAGLVIGLTQGQVGSESCGTIRVTVPWTVVTPGLSATGRLLVAGLP